MAGLAVGKGGSSTTQKANRISRLKSSTTLPRPPFFDAVPTSVITEALRGHPRREHFVVIRGGVLKYAGQRRLRT